MPIAIRRRSLGLACLTLLAACASATPAPTPHASPAPPAAVIGTPSPAAPTAAPTATDAPIAPVAATAAPAPIKPSAGPEQAGLAEPTATPTFPDAVISPANAAQLRLLRTLGYGAPLSAAIAPQAGLLALGTSGGLALFDWPKLRLIRFEPSESSDGIITLDISPDGQQLLVNGQLRQLDDPRPLATLGGTAPGSSRAIPRFSGDSAHILAVEDPNQPSGAYRTDHLALLVTKVWRRDGSLVLERPGYAAAFSADGSLVALADGAVIRVFRSADGAAEDALPIRIAPDDYVKYIAFSADLRQIIVALPGQVQVWDRAGQRLASSFPLPEAGDRHWINFDNILISPDGSKVAAARQIIGLPRSSYVMYDTATGAETGLYQNMLTFSADGALGVNWDNPLGFHTPPDDIAVVDFRSGAVETLATPNFLHLAFSPDGQRLAASSATQIFIWDVVSSELLATYSIPLRQFADSDSGYPGATGRLSYAPDGSLLAVGGSELIMYGDYAGQYAAIDTNTGAAAMAWNEYLQLHYASNGTGMVVRGGPAGAAVMDLAAGITTTLDMKPSAAAISTDGRKALAIGAESGRLLVWREFPGAPQERSLDEPITGLWLSAGDEILAARLKSGRTLLWQTDGLAPLGEITLAPDGALLFAPDGKLAIAGGPVGMQIVNLADGRTAASIPGAVSDLAIGPRGRLLGAIRAGRIELYGVAP
ncbi:MAG TPA: hypothetical protein VGE07_04695 [Herpetosiphonaceae bacterium]